MLKRYFLKKSEANNRSCGPVNAVHGIRHVLMGPLRKLARALFCFQYAPFSANRQTAFSSSACRGPAQNKPSDSRWGRKSSLCCQSGNQRGGWAPTRACAATTCSSNTIQMLPLPALSPHLGCSGSTATLIIIQSLQGSLLNSRYKRQVDPRRPELEPKRSL